MPLELGIFLGAAKFGSSKQQKKRCLILDRDQYRYQRFCSDIAGHDIQPHADRIEDVIRGVRNWLSSDLAGQGVQIPGASKMVARYAEFRQELPDLCRELKLSPRELIYREYANLVVSWLRANPW